LATDVVRAGIDAQPGTHPVNTPARMVGERHVVIASPTWPRVNERNAIAVRDV
jgi:hypothetical protein